MGLNITQYNQAITELKSFQNLYFINLENIIFWLNKHSKLFLNSINNYSCSIHEPKLPCFCCIRRTDCLFIDLYKELESQKKIIQKEEIYGNYVSEYELFKSNGIDLNNWINDHKRLFYDSYINEKGIIIQLNASKKDDEYLKFIIRIHKSEFKNHNRLNKILDEIINIETE